MPRDETETRGPQGSADEHDEVQARLSDYYEGLLAEEEAREVGDHLEHCTACGEAYRELEQTVGALSGLHRMAAPQTFEKGVEETIHRRSAGRFFGRRAFGDRIPFEILAILAIALGLAIYAMLRASETGSLSTPSGGEGEVEAPERAPAP